ncbi:MAG: hypothetical protein OEW19_15130 [Acidobacteriota bacterium]|nr:hypothetical protein [Acidobacteriota bacterium]
MAARFHDAVADAVLAVVRRVRAATGALSGGVFQNVRLLDRTVDRTRAPEERFEVWNIKHRPTADRQVWPPS